MSWTDPIRRMAAAMLREQEEARRLIEVVRHGLRGLVKSQIPRMAAALAYRTLFSLIPVLVVGAVVMGAFLSDEELRDQMNRLIDYVGLDTIVLDEEAVGAGGWAAVGPALPIEMADHGEAGLVPSKRLDEWITGLVERVSGLPFRAIGIVGVAVLVYGALSMLVELERAFNQIYGVSSGRSWVKRVTTYWTTLTLGVVFLLATFSVGDLVANWVASLGRDGQGEGGWLSRGLIEFVVNTSINTLVLLVAYATVPNARVHLRPAIGGAAIAGVAWEIGKVGFTQYVQRAVGGLEQLYGVMALLPLFMLWVYITWIVVLFGLQVSHALQTFESRNDADASARGPVDPAMVLTVARLAADRFEAGRTLTVDDVTEHTGLTGAQSELFLRSLAAAGVVREVEGAELGFVLGRPPASVSVADLLTIARSMRSGGTRGGDSRVDAAVDAAMQGLVLADLQSIPRSDDGSIGIG